MYSPKPSGEANEPEVSGSASMNVLLVYPRFPVTFWSFNYALRFKRKCAVCPPLGLITLASLLPTHWNLRLADLNLEDLRDSDLSWADAVMISAMLLQKESMLNVIRRCRRAGLRIVVGGPVSNAMDLSPMADAVVHGEAESLAPELAADLERGSLKPEYRAPEVPPISLSPVPAWRLLKQRRYNSMAVQYSRGCPFDCEFCDIIEVFGRRPRTKAPGQILAELDALYESGWRGSVFLVDDNFIGNKVQVKKLLPELAEWNDRRGKPFSFFTQASLNLAEDDDLLRLMCQANFVRVFLGIESPVEASLREGNKLQNLRRDMVESVHKIQRSGLEVMGGFIVGFDSDPPDVFEKQYRFIHDSAIPIAMVGLLNAVPNTRLYRRLEREGRLLAENSGDNTDARLSFIPRLSPDLLVEGYKGLVQRLYQPAEYYQRVLRFLEVRRDAAATVQRELTDYLAALTSLLRQGFFGHSRRSYWRFLCAAMRQSPARLADAIQFAVMGYHFQRVADLLSGSGADSPAAPQAGSSTGV